MLILFEMDYASEKQLAFQLISMVNLLSTDLDILERLAMHGFLPYIKQLASSYQPDSLKFEVMLFINFVSVNSKRTIKLLISNGFLLIPL